MGLPTTRSAFAGWARPAKCSEGWQEGDTAAMLARITELELAE